MCYFKVEIVICNFDIFVIVSIKDIYYIEYFNYICYMYLIVGCVDCEKVKEVIMLLNIKVFLFWVGFLDEIVLVFDLILWVLVNW